MKSYLKPLFFLVSALVTIPQFSFSHIRVNSGSENQWQYEDCSCGLDINLKIHNGLSGSYGGQLIAENIEYTKGALTVANLNDTDGNDTLDFMDNSVVTTAMGRDEVDLMKLVISNNGSNPGGCPDIQLLCKGNIKLWKNKTKGQEVSKIIPIASLPKTIWIEAVSVSNVIQDIEIEAVVDGQPQDTVRATAIWAEILNSEVYTSDSSNPLPSTLGVDSPGLLATINNEHMVLPFGFRSKNGNLYGFGTMAKGNMVAQRNIDLYFGGKILFRFKLLPHNAYQLGGIHLDIGRRKFTSDIVYNGNMYSPIVQTESPPPDNEHANDDDPAYDNADEDKIPNSNGYFFSYGTPATINGFNTNLALTNLHDVFLRDLIFEEYARVSFGVGFSGNKSAGSRCSNKMQWKASFANNIAGLQSMAPSKHELRYMIYSQANGNSVITTRPRLITMPQPMEGNGTISITTTSSTYNVYRLQYNTNTCINEWDLSKLSNTNTKVHIKCGTTLSNGDYEVNAPDVMVSIKNGSIPFNSMSEYCFINCPIPNIIKNTIGL